MVVFPFLKPLMIPDSNSCPYLGYCFPSLPDAVLYFFYAHLLSYWKNWAENLILPLSNLRTLLAPITWFFLHNFCDHWFLFCAGWWKMCSKNIIQKKKSELANLYLITQIRLNFFLLYFRNAFPNFFFPPRDGALKKEKAWKVAMMKTVGRSSAWNWWI